MESKVCTSCGETLPISEFYLRSDTGAYRSQCKSCHGEHSYSTRDKSKHRINSYRSQLKKKYGMDAEAFNVMYEEQEGKCGICDIQLENIFTDTEGVRPAVDHCHRTGKVRGLLCTECNSGIGKLKDDPELLRKGIKWLEHS